MCGTSIRAKVNHAIAVGGSPFTYTHGVSADTVIERQAGIVFLTLTGVTLTSLKLNGFTAPAPPDDRGGH